MNDKEPSIGSCGALLKKVMKREHLLSTIIGILQFVICVNKIVKVKLKNWKIGTRNILAR